MIVLLSQLASRRAAIVLPIAAAIGCDDGPHDTRWDIAPVGVEVVTNPARANAPFQLVIADQPTLRVGGPAGRPEDELESSRGALTATMLADGGLVVTEESRIHFFSPDGQRRTVLGSRGEGPGEFQNVISSCRTLGDTVVVEDLNNGRIVVIDAAAPAIVRTFPNAVGHLFRKSCFDDGTIVVQDMIVDNPSGTRGFAHIRLRLDGTIVDTLLVMQQSRNTFRSVGMPRHVTRGATWYYGDPYFGEIRLFDRAGKLVRVIRFDELPQEVSEREALAARGFAPAQGNPAGSGDEGARVRLPYFGAIHADPLGRVWVNDVLSPESAQTTWTRFDAAGKLQARLALPAPGSGSEVSVLEFTATGILVHRTDQNGDAWVEHYELVAGPGI